MKYDIKTQIDYKSDLTLYNKNDLTILVRLI